MWRYLSVSVWVRVSAPEPEEGSVEQLPTQYKSFTQWPQRPQQHQMQVSKSSAKGRTATLMLPFQINSFWKCKSLPWVQGFTFNSGRQIKYKHFSNNCELCVSEENKTWHSLKCEDACSDLANFKRKTTLAMHSPTACKLCGNGLFFK